MKIQHTHHILDDLILAVLPLHFEKVIAEVEEVEATLLSQQHDDSTAGPVQPIPKALSVSRGMREKKKKKRSMSLSCKLEKL